MKFQVTKEDLMRGTVVEPGWYNVEVAAANDELAKDGQSTNCVVDFKIIEGKFEGVKVRTWFSEKAPGMVVPFATAFGIKFDPQKGGDFDPTITVGRKLRIYITNQEYNKKMQNQVSDYRPAA